MEAGLPPGLLSVVVGRGTAFGGENASGIGRFGGVWAMDELTTDRWISVQHEPRELPI